MNKKQKNSWEQRKKRTWRERMAWQAAGFVHDALIGEVKEDALYYQGLVTDMSWGSKNPIIVAAHLYSLALSARHLGGDPTVLLEQAGDLLAVGMALEEAEDGKASQSYMQDQGQGNPCLQNQRRHGPRL